jgi:hypothetical protein
VDYIFCFQICAGSGYSLSWRQRAALLADFLALCQKNWPGSTMNRSIHAASAQQPRIGGVHDRIGGFFSDIAHGQFKRGLGTNPISHAVRHLFVGERFHARKFLAFQKFQ